MFLLTAAEIDAPPPPPALLPVSGSSCTYRPRDLEQASDVVPRRVGVFGDDDMDRSVCSATPALESMYKIDSVVCDDNLVLALVKMMLLPLD